MRVSCISVQNTNSKQNVKSNPNKNISFRRAPGMSTGTGNHFPQENPQPKRDGGLLDAIYWTMIANTLAINPLISNYFIDKREADLQQYKQDAQSYNTYSALRSSINENYKTSNAIYHLNLFNLTEIPEMKKLDDSLYSAKFNTNGKDIDVVFSTKELDKNIISGEIAANDGNTTDLYTYKMNLDTLGSRAFDIELKGQNDSTSIKQTYERDLDGYLYYVDKENKKRIPVNEYSVSRANAKEELENEIADVDRVYRETQKFNYMICFIATIFQMMRYSRSRKEEDGDNQ